MTESPFVQAEGPEPPDVVDLLGEKHRETMAKLDATILDQDDVAPTPVDWDLERKETIYYDKPKTGTESSSVPAPKSVLSDEEFDKLVTQHSMPSLADIYKKGLKQNVLRPLEAYAHKN